MVLKLTLWNTIKRSSNFPWRSPQTVNCLENPVEILVIFGNCFKDSLTSRNTWRTYFACNFCKIDNKTYRSKRDVSDVTWTLFHLIINGIIIIENKSIMMTTSCFSAMLDKWRSSNDQRAAILINCWQVIARCTDDII